MDLNVIRREVLERIRLAEDSNKGRVVVRNDMKFRIS